MMVHVYIEIDDQIWKENSGNKSGNTNLEKSRKKYGKLRWYPEDTGRLAWSQKPREERRRRAGSRRGHNVSLQAGAIQAGAIQAGAIRIESKTRIAGRPGCQMAFMRCISEMAKAWVLELRISGITE